MKVIAIVDRNYTKSFICEITETELKKVMNKAGYRDEDEAIKKIRLDTDFPIAEGFDFCQAIEMATRSMQSAYDNFQKVAPVMAKFAGLVAQA